MTTGAAEPCEPLVFVAKLRSRGVPVPLSASVTFVSALGLVDAERIDDVYWTGRTTLVSRLEHLAIYDEVFAEVFLAGGGDADASVIEKVDVTGFDLDDECEDRDDGDTIRPDALPAKEVRWSRLEVLRDRDFADCDSTELVELWRAIARLRAFGVKRRSLGCRAERDRVGRLDLRRTIACSMRVGGEVTELVRSTRARRPRPIVMLVDVSGSMEPYARALMRFAHAIGVARERVEVFALGTRLTRLTRELEGFDPDAAMARAAAAVDDWSGGTRLGEGLTEFCDRWGQRGIARGAVVLVMSDGWDRGEPLELDRAMSRLSLLANRIVWVNPLRATPGYAPLARGMATALPYCDRFVDGHSLAALEDLVVILEDLDVSSAEIAAPAHRMLAS